MRKKDLFGIFVFIIVIVFCFRLVSNGKIPAPVDALVGLYYPFRDFYAAEYPRGIPFRNSLITDPVLQQIPWRQLSVDVLKQFELPLWNPYSFSGYPLLGNIQSAPLYPLNIVLFFIPFITGWTFLIILQPFLGSLFMYWYLRNLKLAWVASIFGSIAFAFSGFFTTWLEWGTVIHTALWFPLVLLSLDKILQEKNVWRWAVVLIAALAFSYLAGHLQTFVYGFLLSLFYALFRFFESRPARRKLIFLILSFLVFIILLFPVWWQQLQFILLSAREVDLTFEKAGWFIPPLHLIQFFAPDFFGNPATGNYWGVWNYGEFLGYIGIFPLVFAFLGVTRKNKLTLFFAGLVVASLLFALENPLAKLPYVLSLPFLSSTQPTRLLFVVDLSLAILAAYGLDSILKQKKPKFLLPFLFICILGLIFVFGYTGHSVFQTITTIDWQVAMKNMILPTFLVATVMVSFLFLRFFTHPRAKTLFVIGVLVITSFDLIFITNKFNSFSSPDYFYPQTKTLVFLKEQEGQFRIMPIDRRILHPNISVSYKLQSVGGYDPLYLMRYGELMAASERGKPDITSPFGFQRIITPQNIDSRIMDLLGVKYILSLSDINSPKFSKVFEEGETKLYRNEEAFERAFFVENVISVSTKKEAIQYLFDPTLDLRETAIIETDKGEQSQARGEYSVGSVKIKEYTENSVILETQNTDDGFLVLTDTYYPTWQVTMDGKEWSMVRTDYNFRGVVVPKGTHTIQFINKLF